MPAQDGAGLWISDDGRFYWNGTAWVAREWAPAMPSGGAKAIWSLAFGLAAAILWILPILGVPVAVAGLVLGIIARSGTRPRMATWGLGLSAVGMALAVLNGILGAYMSVTGRL